MVYGCFNVFVNFLVCTCVSVVAYTCKCTCLCDVPLYVWIDIDLYTYTCFFIRVHMCKEVCRCLWRPETPSFLELEPQEVVNNLMWARAREASILTSRFGLSGPPWAQLNPHLVSPVLLAT